MTGFDAATDGRAPIEVERYLCWRCAEAFCSLPVLNTTAEVIICNRISTGKYKPENNLLFYCLELSQSKKQSNHHRWTKCFLGFIGAMHLAMAHGLTLCFFPGDSLQYMANVLITLHCWQIYSYVQPFQLFMADECLKWAVFSHILAWFGPCDNGRNVQWGNTFSL